MKKFILSFISFIFIFVSCEMEFPLKSEIFYETETDINNEITEQEKESDKTKKNLIEEDVPVNEENKKESEKEKEERTEKEEEKYEVEVNDEKKDTEKVIEEVEMEQKEQKDSDKEKEKIILEEIIENKLDEEKPDEEKLEKKEESDNIENKEEQSETSVKENIKNEETEESNQTNATEEDINIEETKQKTNEEINHLDTNEDNKDCSLDESQPVTTEEIKTNENKEEKKEQTPDADTQQKTKGELDHIKNIEDDNKIPIDDNEKAINEEINATEDNEQSNEQTKETNNQQITNEEAENNDVIKEENQILIEDNEKEINEEINLSENNEELKEQTKEKDIEQEEKNKSDESKNKAEIAEQSVNEVQQETTEITNLPKNEDDTIDKSLDESIAKEIQEEPDQNEIKEEIKQSTEEVQTEITEETNDGTLDNNTIENETKVSEEKQDDIEESKCSNDKIKSDLYSLTNPMFTKTWTVMMYVPSVDKEKSYSLINNLQNINLSDNLNLIVFYDENINENGKLCSSLLRINKNETVLCNIDSIDYNFGSKETLSLFIEYVKNVYPAEKYGIVFWNQCSECLNQKYPAFSLAKDNKQNDFLYINEVKDSLESDFLKEKLAFTVLDMNFGASLEYAAELKGVSNFLGGVEGFVNEDEFDYDKWFSNLNENCIDGKDALLLLNNSFASLKNRYSVIDLSLINELLKKLNDISIAASSKLINEKQRQMVNEKYVGKITNRYADYAIADTVYINISDFVKKVRNKYYTILTDLDNEFQALINQAICNVEPKETKTWVFGKFPLSFCYCNLTENNEEKSEVPELLKNSNNSVTVLNAVKEADCFYAGNNEIPSLIDRLLCGKFGGENNE